MHDKQLRYISLLQSLLLSILRLRVLWNHFASLPPRRGHLGRCPALALASGSVRKRALFSLLLGGSLPAYLLIWLNVLRRYDSTYFGVVR
jgi:hypothetical protein